jgi:OOP family OmpA-OmpF porin
MKCIKNYLRFELLVLPVALLVGCASSPKADLPANTNPNDEITRLKSDIANGDANDYAVLDAQDFSQSKDYLAKAEDKMRNNKSQEDVLDQLRTARGYYDRAQKTATERRSHISTVLDARDLAVSAGSLQYPQTRKELESVDKDAQDLAESSDTPSSEKVMKLQERYGVVQLSALETQYLGDGKATIEAAKSQGATSIAPKTYNQAKVDYDNAKMSISMNRASPVTFMPAVKQSQLSTNTLSRVMEMAKKSNKNFNEDEAVRIVEQDRKIHALDTVVNNQDAQKSALTAQKSELAAQKSQLQDTLTTQQQDLRESRKKVAMQKALQSAQDEFSNKEAEVYQKDNQLLIRLKTVGFASGSAKIPDSSTDLLSKVQTVVEGLKPESIVIQGHTDSTGGKAVNEKLSQKRADEVASYFEKNGINSNEIKTEGYGDSKPLATNNTKEGRAENRRIDILVTPSGSDL